MNPYFRDYADFLASYFEGKVQKISVDAAMGCPNRDGTTGHGGCIYCNLRDSHHGIVDHHGKLISPCPVGTPQNKIAAFSRKIKRPFAEKTVGKCNLPVGNIEACRRLSSCFNIRKCRQRQGAATASVDHPSVGLMRRLCGHYVGTGACARICIACGDNTLNHVGIYIAPTALAIRSAGSAIFSAALVPVESEPIEIVLYHTGILRPRTLRVEILDTKNPASATAAHRQPRHHGCKHIPQVHTTCRRWGKTADNPLFCHSYYNQVF